MASALYDKLDIERKEIRLLELDPAASYDDDLVGRLSTASLLSNPQFRALSYVCGSADDPKFMTLSEIQVSIYKALDQALRHIRSTEEKLILWTDQLCIHQMDLDERADQVHLMCEIYDGALEVLVHIGSSHDESAESVPRVSETIHTLGRLQQDEHYTGSLDLLDTWSHILDFFKTDYWFRMWTTQELILAKKATFYYGKASISDDMVDAFYTWYVNHMALRRCCRGNDDSNFIDLALDIASQAYETTRANRAAKRKGQTFKLLDLLGNFRHRHTTVLHDKVFALAGLVQIPSHILEYKATPEVTFERTTVHLIESTGTLDVFNHLSVNGPTFGSIRVEQVSARKVKNDYDRLPTLASWCPDWSLYFKSKEMTLLSERVDLLHLYQASGSTPALIKCVGAKLHVQGLRCGVISGLSVCYERPMLFNSSILQAWAKTAGVSLGELTISDGKLTNARLRFVLALTGGLGVTADGKVFLMKTREDYLRHEYLSMAWWQMEYLKETKLGVLCSRDILETLDYYHENHLRSFIGIFDYIAIRNTFLRRFVVLEDGRFGFAPPTAMVGDVVCVLDGGRTPFVLGTGRRRWTSCEGSTRTEREEPDAGAAGCFQLIGDAYVEGLMDGSAFKEGEEQEEFVLV